MATNFDVLADGLNKYVVRPLNAFGLGGFVFDVDGETTVNLTAEITDHFLEDNSTVQDHIAVKPKRVVLNHYVGELVHREDESFETNVQKVVQKLTILNSFLPTLSKAATQITETLRGDNLSGASFKNVTLESINKATDYWAFAKNISPPQNKQEQAYLYLKALMEGKFLVSLQTPFEFINNMAIESVVARQPEKSKYISDFTIQLKEIRTASLLNAPEGSDRFVESAISPEDNLQGRNFYQSQSPVTIGNIPGLPVPGDPLEAHRRARELRKLELDGLIIEDLTQEQIEDLL